MLHETWSMDPIYCRSIKYGTWIIRDIAVAYPKLLLYEFYDQELSMLDNAMWAIYQRSLQAVLQRPDTA